MYAECNILHSPTLRQVRYSHLFIAAQLERFRLHAVCVRKQLSVPVTSRLLVTSSCTGLHGIIIQGHRKEISTYTAK